MCVCWTLSSKNSIQIQSATTALIKLFFDWEDHSWDLGNGFTTDPADFRLRAMVFSMHFGDSGWSWGDRRQLPCTAEADACAVSSDTAMLGYLEGLMLTAHTAGLISPLPPSAELLELQEQLQMEWALEMQLLPVQSIECTGKEAQTPVSHRRCQGAADGCREVLQWQALLCLCPWQHWAGMAHGAQQRCVVSSPSGRRQGSPSCSQRCSSEGAAGYSTADTSLSSCRMSASCTLFKWSLHLQHLSKCHNVIGKEVWHGWCGD